MTPFSHPAVALAVFKQRLSEDILATGKVFTLACGRATPIADTALEDPCSDWLRSFNSQVDWQTAGDLSGQVLGYCYNRVDLGKLLLPALTFTPYLRGAAATVADLLEQVNARSGLQLDVSDVVATPLPQCDTACQPIGFDLVVNPDSLLYIGSLRLYVYAKPLSLPNVLTQPFVQGQIAPPLAVHQLVSI